MHNTVQTIIIGGGISGLACAYRLRQMDIPVLLLERARRVGGVIESVEQNGFLFELGPQSFLSTDKLLEVIGALGLGPELLRASPHAPRFVLAKGRLERVPMSPPELLTSSLLSRSTKWRLASEPFRRSQPPEEDESVAGFVRRKFGAELLDRLAGPFVSGVYAGDPEKLSLRSAFPSVYAWEKQYGSVLRGTMKSRPRERKARSALCSFSHGVATLVRALGERLGEAVRCGASVASVTRSKANGKGQFTLQVNGPEGAQLLTANAVVVATETPAAGQLLAGVSAEFPVCFERIEYAPVAVVAVGYRREQVSHPADGFGFLVARQEGLRVLGCVWNSSLFPGRAPKGMVNLTSFAGGATDAEICEWSEERIGETVGREVAEVLKISGPPVTRLISRHRRALPQYNLGHGSRVAALREACARVPGLFLAGNYLEGPAIGACVEQAFRVAESVRQYCTSGEELGGAQNARGHAVLEST